MTAHSAVGVDDDLAAGEAGVSLRTADHEAAGRIDVILDVLRPELLRNHGLDHVGDDGLMQLLVGDAIAVLRGNDDGVDRHRHTVLVNDSHL